MWVGVCVCVLAAQWIKSMQGSARIMCGGGKK